jgi:hypothetical protein
MSFDMLMVWLTPQQISFVRNSLEHVSSYLAKLWMECVNEESEPKLRQHFMRALWWYFKSHPPRDGYETFLRMEAFDVIQGIRDVSDAKHFWATLVELMRMHTTIMS